MQIFTLCKETLIRIECKLGISVFLSLFWLGLILVTNTRVMKHHKLLIAAMLLFTPIVIFAQPASYFMVDAEGWTAKCECATDPTSAWAAVAGSPGGAFTATDNTKNFYWYYNSPAAFNINLSPYYNGCLQFDERSNANAADVIVNIEDVMIQKLDGTRIVYDTPYNPGPTFTHYNIALVETGWKYTSLAGAAVTYVDFIDYLTNCSLIKIRGDYTQPKSETVWIDNVIICGPILLPIELANFTASLQNNSVAELQWETYSEQNSSYFEIEKSVDNAGEFIPIGTVKAAGTSTELNSYIFEDENWNSDSYYRLKIVDNDGTLSYSEIVVVTGHSTTSANVQLYPNPAHNTLIITNSFPGFSYNTIKIVDAYGRTVKLITNIDASITNGYPIDVSDLITGIYFITLNNEIETHALSFQVSH